MTHGTCQNHPKCKHHLCTRESGALSAGSSTRPAVVVIPPANCYPPYRRCIRLGYVCRALDRSGEGRYGTVSCVMVSRVPTFVSADSSLVQASTSVRASAQLRHSQ